MSERIDKLLRQEESANVLEYMTILKDETVKRSPFTWAVIMDADDPGESLDNILAQINYTLAFYKLELLDNSEPRVPVEHLYGQVCRLNQARDALVRAKDARDIHETT